MRVTNQQIMNQMLSDVKKIESQSAKGLEKGQVFKAVIREVMSDSLLLELKSGELLRASLPNGGTYAQGSTQSFEVVENGKQLIVRPFSEEAMASLEKTLENLFKGSGEQVTPEKISAAKALLSFGQPISKESIEEMISTAKQVDTFKGLIEADLIKLSDIPPKSPVKQVLLSHYANSSDASMTNEADLVKLLEASLKGTSKGLDLSGQAVKENMDRLPLEGDNLVKNSAESQGLKTDENASGQKEAVQSEKSESNQAGQNLQDKVETTEKLLDLLKNVDFQKLAFHKSANMNTSVQNLAMLDKLLFGKDTIGNQLQALIQTLKASADEIPQEVRDLFENLKGLGLKEDENLDKNLMKIIETLESAEEKESPLTQVKNQVVNLQQSIDYMKNINESMTYFQMPLQVGNEFRSVDFFVKKRNKSKGDSDDTTIFISLDTHYLETVQVLLEYKKQNVDIQFRLSDEKVVERLQSNQAELDAQLSEVSDKMIHVSFRVKDKTQTNLDSIAELSSASSASIDMKV